MRDYGVVSPQFWIGDTGKTLRGNLPAQIVALYLMTSPHANMIGVFYCPLDTIAKETGLPLEGATEALRSLVEAHFCLFDARTEEVFVNRMAAFQVGEQLEVKDNRCKGIARELDRVMSARLKTAFRAIYSVAFHLPVLIVSPPPPPPSPAPKASPLQAPPKPEAGSEAETGSEDSAKAGGEPPSVREQVFASGVALLTAADVSEKNARSMLAMLCKKHGEPLVLEAIQATARDHPGEPVSWLQSKLAAKPSRTGNHAGFSGKNYREGVNTDGSFN